MLFNTCAGIFAMGTVSSGKSIPSSSLEDKGGDKSEGDGGEFLLFEVELLLFDCCDGGNGGLPGGDACFFFVPFFFFLLLFEIQLNSIESINKLN